MGILSVIKTDVEQLVKEGCSNEYISKSVGYDLNMIEYIVSYVKKELSSSKELNKKKETKRGDLC